MAKSWREVRNKKLDVEAQARVDRSVKLEALKIRLKQVREHLNMTQVEMAAATQRTQSEISKLENRNDILLSTLLSYIADAGGKIEINAVFEDKAVSLI